jgi:hypothetical protein
MKTKILKTELAQVVLGKPGQQDEKHQRRLGVSIDIEVYVGYAAHTSIGSHKSTLSTRAAFGSKDERITPLVSL